MNTEKITIKGEKYTIATDADSGWIGHYQIQNQSGNYFMLYKHPTGNCQLNAIAWMNFVFKFIEDEKSQGLDIDITTARLQYLQQNCYSSKAWLIDITKKYDHHMQKLLEGKDCVMHRGEYQNANGTPMCLYIINVDKFFNI